MASDNLRELPELEHDVAFHESRTRRRSSLRRMAEE